MPSFEDTLARLAAIPDAALADGWTWRDGKLDVRYALFRSLEEEQEAAVAARRDWRGEEGARILGLAQLAFGDLRALLVGLDDATLDRVPAEGEWSVRETLAHVIAAQRSYRANTEWALGRTDAEALQIPAERRPPPDPADTAGDGSAIVRRLAARLAEAEPAVQGLDDAGLARPAQWGDFRVDVRFRLHRFASHIVEHTIQCETTLERIGQRAGDARRTVRRISQARAMHERISGADVLARLDAAHAGRAGSIATGGS